MQIAIFKDVNKANEFALEEDKNVKSLNYDNGSIVVFYEPVISLEEFRRKEILRTLRVVQENLETARINTSMFEIERSVKTGTAEVEVEKHIATSKTQEAMFAAKITELTLMLNGQGTFE